MEDWVELLAQTEAARLEPAHGEAPREPPAYDHTYTLPAHRVKLLERRHACDRDERIVFLEEPHIYLVDDAPVEVSVTGIAGAYSEVFNGPMILQNMMKGSKQAWPRLKYAIDPVRIELGEPPAEGRSVLVVDARDADNRTLFAGTPHVFGAEWALRVAREGLARCRLRCDVHIDDLAFYSYARGMSALEVEAEWERNRIESSNRGTEAHLTMELWSNSEPVRLCGELRFGLTFVREQLVPHGIQAFRTEWELFAENEGFAGSCDWVGRLPSGNLIIVDWKRTQNHDIHSPYRKKMKPPLQHIDDTDVAKFALQLSIYMWIIETYYGYRVEALALCSIHPEHGFFSFVPYLRTEVEFLMAKRRQRMAQRALIEREYKKEAPQCSISHNVAWEPVRVGDDLCDLKQAQWKRPGEPTRADKEAQCRMKRIEEATVTEDPGEVLALRGAQAWNERVPSVGFLTYTPCRDI